MNNQKLKYETEDFQYIREINSSIYKLKKPIILQKVKADY